MASVSCTSSCAAASAIQVTATLTVTAGNQSVSGNYTTINYSYSAVRNNYGFIGTTRDNVGTLQVLINGSVVRSVAVGLTYAASGGNTECSGSGSVNVSHNSDGTKSFTYQVKIVGGSDPRGANYYWNSSSSSAPSMTLTTIPRATQPNMSASSVTMGNAITINTPRASSSFTHSLWYQVNGGNWQDIASGVGTSYSWTVPVGLASSVPNGTNISVTVICRTYNGSTNLGDKYTSFTAYVPDSVVPSMGNPTATRVDNGVPSGWGVYVKGYSKVTIAITSASGSYGSTIKSYSISGPNLSSTSSSATSGVLGSSGTNTYTCKVTDSRGRTATKTVSISVVDYSKPSISVSASRCNSDGTVSSSGTYLRVTASYSIASVSSKNSVSSRSVSCNGASNTSFSSSSAFVLAANCAINTSYTLTASVTDALNNTASASITIPTASRIMNVRANKSGIAFGKFAEADNIFDVALSSTFRKISEHKNGAYLASVFYGGYSLSGATGNNEWVKLGTYHDTWDTASALITVMTGGGYNGAADQNTKIEIFVKDGWQLSTSATSSFGVSYVMSHNSNSGIQVKALASAHNSVDIWVYMPWGHWAGHYTIKCIGAWTHSGEHQTSEPSGTAQECAGKQMLDSSNYDGYLNTGVKDIGDSNKITFSYSKSSLNYSDYTWLAAWDGYELRAVNKNQFLPLSGGTMTGNIKMDLGKEVIGGHLAWGYVEGNGIYGFADATTYLEIRTASHGAKGINWWDSDASLKKNIKNTEVRYALEKISQLKHIEFDWKENDSHVDLGYVADDVEKILPCLVFEVAQYGEDGKPNGEAIKNIDYRTMIPLITMGIQELIEESDLLWTFDEEAANCIIKLREEVDSLKSTVNELKAEIEYLKKAISV